MGLMHKIGAALDAVSWLGWVGWGLLAAVVGVVVVAVGAGKEVVQAIEPGEHRD